MKTLLRLLSFSRLACLPCLLCLLCLPRLHAAADAADDVIVAQRKSDNSGSVQRNVAPSALGLFGFDASKHPISFGLGTGLSIVAGNLSLTGSGTGDMLGAHNLSELTNAATARSNLGLVIGTNVLAPNGNGSGLSGIVTSLAGTANQITASGSTGGITLSLATGLQSINSVTAVSGNDLTLAGASGKSVRIASLPIKKSTVHSSADWAWVNYDGGSSDDVMALGLNLNASGGTVDGTEPVIWLGFESNYSYAGTPVSELYLRFTSINGLVHTEPFYSQMVRATGKLGDTFIRGNTIQYEDSDGNHIGKLSITNQSFHGFLDADGNLNSISATPSTSTGLHFGYNYSGGSAEGNIVLGATTPATQYARFSSWNGTTMTEMGRWYGNGNLTVYGTINASNLSGTNTGDQTITLTGDVTGSGTGSFAATLATVNTNVGTFGDSTHIPNITVNGKGLITAAGNTSITVPTAANPTATVGPTATNGSASTFMRSDAAPALANTTVTAGSYGNATTVATFTVDAQGRLTAAGNTTISTGVTSITGTANQVTASASTGAVTLSLPQSIGTAATPQFANLGIGTAAAANDGLIVSATLSGSSNQFGIVSTPTLNSSATSQGAAFYGGVTTANYGSPVTLTSTAGLKVLTPVVGTNSTITTGYGILINDQTASGVGTAYAIYTGSGKISIGDTTSSTNTSSGAVVINNAIGLGGNGAIYAANITASGNLFGTFDANAAGSTLKWIEEMQFTHPHQVDGTGATLNTTATSATYGHATFSNSAAKTANYVLYRIDVPYDFDSGTDLAASFAFRLGGADTGKHAYEISMADVADSAGADAPTFSNAIALNFGGDASGASGDTEHVGYTTLTSWKSSITAGHTLVIKLARAGDDGTNDTSTVNSSDVVLKIKMPHAQ